MTAQPLEGVFEGALAALAAKTFEQKVLITERLTRAWAQTRHQGDVPSAPPDTPGRPVAPELVPPSDVPRRRLGSESGRAALLHAVAHIEFNAINLALDMLCRFAGDPHLPDGQREDFIDDWVSVASDEARHFELVRARLKQLGHDYGDFPAHNGLWEAALATKDKFAARLAIAPMVLEARGLDVTPAMIKKLERAGDTESAAVLKIILTEEVGHVAIGTKWFHRVAAAETQEPKAYFQALVATYFKGRLKPPFNHSARLSAGMPKTYYASEE